MDKRTKKYKQWKAQEVYKNSKEKIFNDVFNLFYEEGMNCNVVWCSPELKHRLLKSIDVYMSDFGTVKIFNTKDVKWNKLKPKKILAFIQE